MSEMDFQKIEKLRNEVRNENWSVVEVMVDEIYHKTKQRPEAGQHETVVNALTSRKQHWMSESRRLVMEKPDSEEAEDATHMYGVYIDAVDDMKTFLKEGH